ncbi:pre-mRNA splicing Prp18-interacting factor, partial [Helicosporidium sp. ATCC 50920]
MLSAEERRRQKELEEARKAGLAAPEVDEEGNAINPHIPQFMASAPWYLSNEGPSLKHQRNWKESLRDDSNWYDRGAKTFQATTYRKGSCPNCGSASHKLKDCLERPRAKGAKWTGRDIAADDKVQSVNLASFDAKRDRWNGYESGTWTRTAEDFEAVSQARAEARRREMLDEGDGAEDAVEAAREEEEDLVRDDDSEVFNKVEKRVRTVGGGSTGSVRNLRIREDTAKYLLNLDPNSAYYDPKSRSMREDPNPQKDAADKAFAGDNFVRTSGQVRDFAQMHAFAVTAYDKGQDVHLQATPSQLEAAYAQFKARKASAQHASAAGLRAAYGDASARDAAQLRELSASEQYAEFDAAGRVVRGALRKAPAR